MLAVADRRAVLGDARAAHEDRNGQEEERAAHHVRPPEGWTLPPERGAWRWASCGPRAAPARSAPTGDAALAKSARPTLAPPAMPAAMAGVCRKKSPPSRQRAMNARPP